jgi:hypothetical protein
VPLTGFKQALRLNNEVLAIVIFEPTLREGEQTGVRARERGFVLACRMLDGDRLTSSERIAEACLVLPYRRCQEILEIS